MSLIKKIALNNFIVLFERLSTAFLGLLVTIWLVRYLGAEKFGIYSLVFAWFTFLNVLTPGMIEQVVAREAVRVPAQMRKYLGAGFCIKLGLAVLGWAIGILTVYLLGYQKDIILYLAIVLFGLVGNASFVLQVPHQIELRLLRPSLADGLSNILYQLSRALAILLKAGLMPFFLLYLAWRLVQLGFFLLLGLEKKDYQPSLKFSFVEVKNIFRASWILLINNIFVMVISRFDQLLIYPILGERAIGLYGGCANLTDYLIMIPTAWYLSVFPLICKYLGQSPEAYQKANYYSYKYLVIVICLVWIIFSGFGSQALTLLFGKEFQDADSALFWLSTAMIFSFIQYGLFSAALSRNLERIWLLVNGIGAFANVALNLILIPRFGIAGAGFATFFAFFIQVALTGLLKSFRSDFLIMFKASIWPIIFASVIVFISRMGQLDLFIFGPVAALVYAGLLLLRGDIKREELKALYLAFLSGNK